MSKTARRLDRLDSTSLTDRVLEQLVNAIHDDHFEAGRLPAETELADQLGVSRTTVRAALQVLDRVGMLERRPGVGTRLRPHVTPEVLALHGLVPFSRLLALRYEKVTAESSLRTGLAASEAQIERLGGDRGEVIEMVEISRVLSADGRAALMLIEQIPAARLGRPLRDRDLDASILTLSRRLFVDHIDHAVATLIPRVASTETARLFEIDKGAPHVFIEETFYDDSGSTLALSDVTVNPELIEFSVVRRGMG